MISFRPIANLRPHQAESLELHGDPYLQELTPESMNLLEALKGDPILQGVEPQLPASRLSRSATTTSNLNLESQILKVAAQRCFRAIPAISARVRYTRSKGGGKPTIIASLDVETAPFFNDNVMITVVELVLFEGLVEDLGGGHALTLPKFCRPRDNQVFVFQLTPNENALDASNSNSRTLDIKIHATVLVSSVCRPRVEMRWTAGVDFSTALNPSYGTPNQPMQRDKRPATIPVPPTPSQSTSIPTIYEVTGSPSKEIVHTTRSWSNSANDLGIAMTLTAPSMVHVGVPFSWEVFVVNRSNIPRKLAIMVIPKRNKNEAKDHLSKPSSSSAGGPKKTYDAEAILDETSLFILERHKGNDPVEIISLSTDVKIGYVNLQSNCVWYTDDL